MRRWFALLTCVAPTMASVSGFQGPVEGCWPMGNNLWQASNGLTLDSAARSCSFDVTCAGFDYNTRSASGAPQSTTTFNFKRGCTLLPQVACGSATNSPNWFVTRDRVCRMPDSFLKAKPHGRRAHDSITKETNYIAFIGCFGRNKTAARCTAEDECPELRDFIAGDGMTVAECAAACRAASSERKEANYDVFGLLSPRRRQWGVCHCGDFPSLRGSEAIQVPDEYCGKPCEGETALVEARCGTKQYASVYALKPPPQASRLVESARAVDAGSGSNGNAHVRATRVAFGALGAGALLALLILTAHARGWTWRQTETDALPGTVSAYSEQRQNATDAGGAML
mmetsp:Transcript_22581/g.58071  ORF Transcript_22581/g.58071 Transcript_22581/m.58071 type:complete len:341 (-) Transcript_22581:200-1222(-)